MSESTNQSEKTSNTTDVKKKPTDKTDKTSETKKPVDKSTKPAIPGRDNVKKPKTPTDQLSSDGESMTQDNESNDYYENVSSTSTTQQQTSGKVTGFKKTDKKQYMKVIKTQIKVKKFGLCSGEGKLVYSSLLNKAYRKYRIEGGVGWRAKTNDTKQWVGLEFMEPFNVSQIQIATADDGAYPSEFYIEYSLDGNVFKRIPKVIKLNKAPTKVVTIEFSEVKALAIRFAITKFVKWPAARFDFLFTDETCSSDEDSAEDSDQTDRYDYDSSVVLNKRATDNTNNYVRSMDIVQIDRNRKDLPNDFMDFVTLYNPGKRQKTEGYLYASEIGVLSSGPVFDEDSFDYGINGKGWKSEKNETNYFGLALPYVVKFGRVEIRPTDEGFYPTKIQIEYSENLQDYKLDEKIYEVGSFDKNGIAVVEIKPVSAMEIRARIIEWVGWPAARFEFLYIDERYQQFLAAAQKMKEKMAAAKKKPHPPTGTVASGIAVEPVTVSMPAPTAKPAVVNTMTTSTSTPILMNSLSSAQVVSDAAMSGSGSSTSSSSTSSGSTTTTTTTTTTQVKLASFTSRFGFSNEKKFIGINYTKNDPSVILPPFTLEYSNDGVTWTCHKDCVRQDFDEKGYFKIDPEIIAKNIRIVTFPKDGLKVNATFSFVFGTL